ncbi:hypothetical protein CETAM_12695 [Corynebacterium comes]|uniref:Uncharacterized protein n=2 Tax=Corynebacterium comes TaxID=2675218 RepID=A0A6B8W183_9CORY|nr:hypothetical protein CETAM_12695 [Corynebacterium comes]
MVVGMLARVLPRTAADLEEVLKEILAVTNFATAGWIVSCGRTTRMGD